MKFQFDLNKCADGYRPYGRYWYFPHFEKGQYLGEGQVKTMAYLVTTGGYLMIRECGYRIFEAPTKEVAWRIEVDVPEEDETFELQYIGIKCQVAKHVNVRARNSVLWIPVGDNPKPKFPHYLPDEFKHLNALRRADLLPEVLHYLPMLDGVDDLREFASELVANDYGVEYPGSVSEVYVLRDRLHYFETKNGVEWFRVSIVKISPNRQFFIASMSRPINVLKVEIDGMINRGEINPIGEWKKVRRSKKFAIKLDHLIEKYGY